MRPDGPRSRSRRSRLTPRRRHAVPRAIPEPPQRRPSPGWRSPTRRPRREDPERAPGRPRRVAPAPSSEHIHLSSVTCDRLDALVCATEFRHRDTNHKRFFRASSAPQSSRASDHSEHRSPTEKRHDVHAGRCTTASARRSASRFGARPPPRTSPAPKPAIRSAPSRLPPPAGAALCIEAWRIGRPHLLTRCHRRWSYPLTQGTRRNTSSTCTPSASRSPSASNRSTCSTPTDASSGIHGAPTTTIRATSSALTNT